MRKIDEMVEEQVELREEQPNDVHHWLHRSAHGDGRRHAMDMIKEWLFTLNQHPYLMLVIVALFCLCMTGWSYAWIVLQIPNPWRMVVLISTVISLTVGACAVNPESRC